MPGTRPIARFIEPMECLPVEKIPEGDVWTYELKLDGYRLIAVKGSGKLTLYSRRGTDLTRRFRYVAEALASLPDETVIDGEVVALDEQGKPNFNLLQNYRSAESHIMLYAFDVLVRRGEKLTQQTLSKRREILESTVKPHAHIGISQVSNQTVKEMLAFVKSHGLEGIIAKRADSVYEPGRRSGLWVKRRINLSQDFVIGGYVPGHLGIDSIVIGFYRDKRTALCGASTRWLRASHQTAGIRTDQASGNKQMPIRESSREGCWTMGTGTNRREDERVRLGEAAGCGRGRIPGVDRALITCDIRSSSAYEMTKIRVQW